MDLAYFLFRIICSYLFHIEHETRTAHTSGSRTRAKLVGNVAKPQF